MLIQRTFIVDFLTALLKSDDINLIRLEINKLKELINNNEFAIMGTNLDDPDSIDISINYLIDELSQIHDTKTIERIKYYINRLIKALTVVKTTKINDINLARWKEYEEIITDSLWMIDRRDSSGAHNAGYWGNFIPQIPHQFLKRYTKKGDWVLDTFLGSGTTLIECQRLGRNGVGIELQQSVADLAQANIQRDNDIFTIPVKTEIVIGNSIELDYLTLLRKLEIESFQFVILHPPYWDIIKFSDDPEDLSNANSKEVFLSKMGTLAGKVFEVLERDRYCALVIGDKYSSGEWIPLGFLTMQEFLNRGFTLKSIIIKNFDETKGKINQKELWRYRALAGGFYVFKHEYIFLFKK